MDELNKKLAEWRWPEYKIQIGDLGRHKDQIIVWNENGYPPEMVEDSDLFTQSLDASFKWLWKKAIKMLADTEREGCEKLLGLWLEEPGPPLTPLALCKAIEKLVDGEKEE